MIDSSTVAGIGVCILVWLAVWAYFRRPKTWDPERQRMRRMTRVERREAGIRRLLEAREGQRRTDRLIKSHRQLQLSLERGEK